MNSQNPFAAWKLHFLFFAFVIGVPTNAQVFQTTSSFPFARYQHCSAQSLNDNVLIFGGINAAASNINSVQEYNPASDTWTSKANIPVANGLGSSACVKLNGGEIILFGGSLNSGATPQSNKAFKYNIVTDSWQILNNLPNSIGRTQMSATLIDDTTVLLLGGISTISGNLTYPATSYIYTTTTDSYSSAGDLPNLYCLF
jgi:N-acetylneuraminic acid mutarotase